MLPIRVHEMMKPKRHLSHRNLLHDTARHLLLPAVVQLGHRLSLWPRRYCTSSRTTFCKSRSVATQARNECGDADVGKPAALRRRLRGKEPSVPQTDRLWECRKTVRVFEKQLTGHLESPAEREPWPPTFAQAGQLRVSHGKRCFPEQTPVHSKCWLGRHERRASVWPKRCHFCD
jgi:hypothetical protein